jgi:hypothetical protein
MAPHARFADADAATALRPRHSSCRQPPGTKLPLSRCEFPSVVSKSSTWVYKLAVAHPVNRRLSTLGARVRAPIKSCGTCGRQRGTGVSFLRVLLFPRKSFNPLIALQSLPYMVQDRCNRTANCLSTSGLGFTPANSCIGLHGLLQG